MTDNPGRPLGWISIEEAKKRWPREDDQMTDKRHSIKGDPLYKAARQAEAEHMQRCVEKVASQMTEAYRNKMIKDATEFLAKIGPDCGGSALALEERKRLGMTDLVTRLRAQDGYWNDELAPLFAEAASRIEELEAALGDLVSACWRYDDEPDSTVVMAAYLEARDKAGRALKTESNPQQ